MKEQVTIVESPVTHPSKDVGDQLAQAMQLILFVNVITRQAKRIANEANLPFSKRAVEKLIYPSK